jgi:hypothetical protein
LPRDAISLQNRGPFQAVLFVFFVFFGFLFFFRGIRFLEMPTMTPSTPVWAKWLVGAAAVAAAAAAWCIRARRRRLAFENYVFLPRLEPAEMPYAFLDCCKLGIL